MAGHVARKEEGRSAFKILTGKPTGKRSLGRPRCRWEDNIRMDLEGIGINAGNWVDSAQDRNYLESPCECSIEPTGSISHGVSLIVLIHSSNIAPRCVYIGNPASVQINSVTM